MDDKEQKLQTLKDLLGKIALSDKVEDLTNLRNNVLLEILNCGWTTDQEKFIKNSISYVETELDNYIVDKLAKRNTPQVKRDAGTMYLIIETIVSAAYQAH